MKNREGFPQTIYVHIEGVDASDYYLAAEATQAGGIKEGERADVATYELKEINRVEWSKKVQLTPALPLRSIAKRARKRS